MSAKKEKRSYRQIKAELDIALLWFDSDTLDVDEAIDKYKQAIVLTNELETYLKEAKNIITQLS